MLYIDDYGTQSGELIVIDTDDGVKDKIQEKELLDCIKNNGLKVWGTDDGARLHFLHFVGKEIWESTSCYIADYAIKAYNIPKEKQIAFSVRFSQDSTIREKYKVNLYYKGRIIDSHQYYLACLRELEQLVSQFKSFKEIKKATAVPLNGEYISIRSLGFNITWNLNWSNISIHP